LPNDSLLEIPLIPACDATHDAACASADQEVLDSQAAGSDLTEQYVTRPTGRKLITGAVSSQALDDPIEIVHAGGVQLHAWPARSVVAGSWQKQREQILDVLIGG
jgi:hypothetical protein